MSMKAYREGLRKRYWCYVDTSLKGGRSVLDSKHLKPTSPPVFGKAYSDLNILRDPVASPKRTAALMGVVPVKERHRWFRSMNSSQALAQSVLGNLKVNGFLHILTGLTDDDYGHPLFGTAALTSTGFALEHGVTYLGEPTSTSLDAFVSGEYQVAIECKFTESDVGRCSRPRPPKKSASYGSGRCDGKYTAKHGKRERCPLTEKKILYWTYIPHLFSWDAHIDHVPCPLNRNYQLVRNVLAACVLPCGGVDANKGHAILLYDGRNPAFMPGGSGHRAFEETRKALINPALLRRCSWQRLITHVRDAGVLPWLTDQLHEKYGF